MNTSLATRLRTLFSLLRQRADLKFDTFTIGTAELPSVADQTSWDLRIPDDFRRFSRELASFTCSYTGPKASDGTPLTGGVTLSALAGPGELEKPEWVPEVDGSVPAVESWILFDVPESWNGECTTFALLPDRSVLLHLYDHPARFESLTDYLTVGARRGFVSYWPGLTSQPPNTPAQQLAVLKAHSLPEETPLAEIHRRLHGAGVNPQVAAELVDWLGSDLTLYFQR